MGQTQALIRCCLSCKWRKQKEKKGGRGENNNKKVNLVPLQKLLASSQQQLLILLKVELEVNAAVYSSSQKLLWIMHKAPHEILLDRLKPIKTTVSPQCTGTDILFPSSLASTASTVSAARAPYHHLHTRLHSKKTLTLHSAFFQRFLPLVSDLAPRRCINTFSRMLTLSGYFGVFFFAQGSKQKAKYAAFRRFYKGSMR